MIGNQYEAAPDNSFEKLTKTIWRGTQNVRFIVLQTPDKEQPLVVETAHQRFQARLHWSPALIAWAPDSPRLSQNIKVSHHFRYINWDQPAMTAPFRISLIFLLHASVSLFGIASADEPYPLEYFAHPGKIRNVRISPDGDHLLLLAIPARDGQTVLEVYDAANPEEIPVRVDSDTMELRTARWLGDDDILIALQQNVGSKTKAATGSRIRLRADVTTASTADTTIAVTVCVD